MDEEEVEITYPKLKIWLNSNNNNNKNIIQKHTQRWWNFMKKREHLRKLPCEANIYFPSLGLWDHWRLPRRLTWVISKKETVVHSPFIVSIKILLVHKHNKLNKKQKIENIFLVNYSPYWIRSVENIRPRTKFHILHIWYNGLSLSFPFSAILLFYLVIKR